MKISEIMEKMIAFSKGNIRTQRQSENWKIWIRKHSIFWKSQQSHMTLHVLSVAKSMAIQTANIRKKKECRL